MKRFLTCFFCVVAASRLASAGVVMQVIPLYQPNGAENTPGWIDWVPRAIDELKDEFVTPDNVGDGLDRNVDVGAVEYAPVSGSGFIDPLEMTVTGFSSWRGTSPDPFGGAERGNRLGFALAVMGTDGTQVSLDSLVGELQWKNIDGTVSDIFADPITADFGGASYSATRVGVDAAGNMIMSGAGSQKVDKLFYVGLGDALCPGGPITGCNGDMMLSDQENIDAVLEKLDGAPQQKIMTMYTVTGMDPDGSMMDFTEMAMVTLVPEPCSWALLLGAFGLLGNFLRRKYRI